MARRVYALDRDLHVYTEPSGSVRGVSTRLDRDDDLPLVQKPDDVDVKETALEPEPSKDPGQAAPNGQESGSVFSGFIKKNWPLLAAAALLLVGGIVAYKKGYLKLK